MLHFDNMTGAQRRTSWVRRVLRHRSCKVEGCRGWADRTGVCPPHKAKARREAAGELTFKQNAERRNIFDAVRLRKRRAGTA